MSRESILLLGGTGFIGSALAARLEREKRTVHILGRRNVEQLAGLLPQCGTVIHLASATTPALSAIHPSLEVDNLDLTLRLLELMQSQPDTHLIFFPPAVRSTAILTGCLLQKVHQLHRYSITVPAKLRRRLSARHFVPEATRLPFCVLRMPMGLDKRYAAGSV